MALTRDYPEYFAAISAMGWMVDLDNQNNVFDNYDMPFQVVQGNGEFTEKTGSAPFVQLVLAEDSEHRPRRPEAEVAWEFFRYFGRDANGRLVELSE